LAFFLDFPSAKILELDDPSIFIPHKKSPVNQAIYKAIMCFLPVGVREDLSDPEFERLSGSIQELDYFL